ncbi:unnamed protein product [Tenebrio molitor]|nr:unnamed protein product [Tenebrio molitor]
MADDSWDIDSIMEFHPCNRPHGMKDYVLSDLTAEQQMKLNVRKREQIRTDQKYLAAHPEIRGLIVMILRILLKSRPKFDIYEAIGQYFTKSSVDLKEEIYAYLEERQNILAVNSTIVIQKSKTASQDTSSVGYFRDEDEESEKLVQTEDMEEAEGTEELEDHIHNLGVRWEQAQKAKETAEELEKISLSSTGKLCQGILNDILENVFEEVDAPSLGSIASVGFPVDYEDHAIGSIQSSEESLD